MMADPISIEFTYQTALAILVVGIPVVWAAIQIIKTIKSNPQETVKNSINDLHIEVQKLEKDIKAIQNELNEINMTMDKLTQGHINYNIIRTQVGDLRTSLERLQDKMEKITDLIIKLVTKG